MDIPKTLNIGGHETQIIIGQDDDLMERLNQIGEFDGRQWIIRVRGGMSESWTKEVVAHEILHALFKVANIQGLEKEVNELVAEGMENHLFRFLVDNNLSWFRNIKAAQG